VDHSAVRTKRHPSHAPIPAKRSRSAPPTPPSRRKSTSGSTPATTPSALTSRTSNRRNALSANPLAMNPVGLVVSSFLPSRLLNQPCLAFGGGGDCHLVVKQFALELVHVGDDVAKIGDLALGDVLAHFQPIQSIALSRCLGPLSCHTHRCGCRPEDGTSPQELAPISPGVRFVCHRTPYCPPIRRRSE